MINNRNQNISSNSFNSGANQEPKLIELLSPAANLSVGKAAIDAGADAVYIGGDRFSARAAAGNSMADIAELCNYARPYGVRVYLALNTLFEGERELHDAKKLAQEAIDAGVSAIIFQDVRVLDMGLEVELHASTQTFIENPSRAIDFERAGVKRLVVERGFSLIEIQNICSSVNVDIEAFVQGAICVAYSGVCSLSEHLTSRSGNRGECAQPCRSNYTLKDGDGKVLVYNSPLLSPKDLNLSARIGELIEAGVSSLKIEGRLKEVDYVVNNVAYYNDLLNEMGVPRQSWGKAKPKFEPNPQLTFNRDFTEWFFDGVKAEERTTKIAAGRLALKGNIGEHVGVVKSVDKGCVVISGLKQVRLANGDGLSFRNRAGELSGVRINRVDGNRLYLLSTKDLEAGMKLYRNSSIEFKPQSERKISITITVSGNLSDGYRLTASAVDLDKNFEVSLSYDEMAQNFERAKTNFVSALQKDGGTIFSVESVDVQCGELPFLPMSALNAMRRELFDGLSKELEGWFSEFKSIYKDGSQTSSSGVQNLKPDYLMRTRYCILREIGKCLRYNKLILPLHLENNGKKIALKFNCTECIMELRKF